MNSEAKQKCGYCAIMGRPNAGKSSLLNTLIGQKIVGVSAKPGTTRNRILGIRLENEHQLLFLDTPGIHRSQKKIRLNSMMNREAWSVIADADVILYVLNAEDLEQEEDARFLANIVKETKVPVFVSLNKADKLKKHELWQAEQKATELVESIAEQMPEQAQFLGDCAVYSISAKRKESLEPLLQDILELLPEGPWLYPDDDLTDRPQTFVCAELIREQAFRLLGAELPYQLAVRVDTIEIGPTLVRVLAEIVVSKPNHRAIVLGKGGQKIKEIGTEARQTLELHFQNKVYLGLEVIIDEDWIQNPISVAEYTALDAQLDH